MRKNTRLCALAALFLSFITAAHAEQCSDYYDPEYGHGDVDRNAINLKMDPVYSKVNFQLTNQYVLDRQHLPLSPGSFDDLTYYNGKPYRPSDLPQIEADAQKTGGVYCSPYGIGGGGNGAASASEMSSKAFYPSLGFHSDKTGRPVAFNDFTRKNCVTESSAMFQVAGYVNTAGFMCKTGGPNSSIKPKDIQKAFGGAIAVKNAKSNWAATTADQLESLAGLPHLGTSLKVTSRILRYFGADSNSSSSSGSGSAASNANQ